MNILRALLWELQLSNILVAWLWFRNRCSETFREKGELRWYGYTDKSIRINHVSYCFVCPLQLAPENTLLSFLKTIESGGDGLESDVTLSYDGVPFLMHDSTLKRTTNVKDVFPNRTNENAAMFTWDALEQLNAGMWFTKVCSLPCL
eukprot:XP_017945162.1 PREDICTED: glycerophosphodiester phosphodiesterase domain-containing protein 5-like [Xenopus tropicalis]